MRYKITIQTWPQPDERAVLITMEVNTSEAAKAILRDAIGHYGFSFDPDVWMKARVGRQYFSMPGGYPFIEFQKRLSL